MKTDNHFLVIWEEFYVICLRCGERMMLVDVDGVESRWACSKCGYMVILHASIKPEGAVQILRHESQNSLVSRGP